MDFLTSLLNSMPGAVAQGLIWGIMAIGVYITYRILDVADLTVDGSLGTGGAVCVMLMHQRREPLGGAACAAMLAGMLAGLVTGLFHTCLRHPGHSGRHSDPAGPLFHQPADHGHRHGRRQGKPARQRGQVRPAGLLRAMSGTLALRQPASSCWPSSCAVADRRAVLVLRHGAGLLAPRHRRQPAHGPGPGHQHQRHQGAGPDDLQRPCGAGRRRCCAQYQGFSDINMGRGAIVIGLAAVIIGEVIFGKLFHNFALKLLAAVFGAIIYYIVIQVVLRHGPVHRRPRSC